MSLRVNAEYKSEPSLRECSQCHSTHNKLTKCATCALKYYCFDCREIHAKLHPILATKEFKKYTPPPEKNWEDLVPGNEIAPFTEALNLLKSDKDAAFKIVSEKLTNKTPELFLKQAVKFSEKKELDDLFIRAIKILDSKQTVRKIFVQVLTEKNWTNLATNYLKETTDKEKSQLLIIMVEALIKVKNYELAVEKMSQILDKDIQAKFNERLMNSTKP